MTPKPTTNPAPKEATEPGVGHSTVPIWLVLIFGALFYWGQLYISDHAGGFDKAVYVPFHSYQEVSDANPKDQSQIEMAMGADVFNKTCVACHQANGMGKDGVAPPLVGSEWVLAAGPNRIERIVLNGLTGPINVKGKDFNLTMPPWKDNFDDQHIAAVLSYVRNNWDNKATHVKPEQVAAARKESHPGPMTSAELQTIPPQ
jgi:mono/diheme cytochrome c family protein